MSSPFRRCRPWPRGSSNCRRGPICQGDGTPVAATVSRMATRAGIPPSEISDLPYFPGRGTFLRRSLERVSKPLAKGFRPPSDSTRIMTPPAADDAIEHCSLPRIPGGGHRLPGSGPSSIRDTPPGRGSSSTLPRPGPLARPSSERTSRSAHPCNWRRPSMAAGGTGHSAKEAADRRRLSSASW
jgi:hypothetical protein